MWRAAGASTIVRMIDARGLTKSYGAVRAVDDLTFTVEPGRVTGFLGPNGSGKSTTLRMILGIDHPDKGSVTVGGKPYADIRYPLHEVGALLESKAVHPSRTAYSHLRWLAASNGIPAPRVEEVLALTGIEKVANRRAKGFSLGMTQRLGVAAAMLGDPGVLLLDEPVNGLDPEGIFWIRQLLRKLADEGRTIFVSSHLMSEMALTADHVIVVGRGRLMADTSIADLVADNSVGQVRVVSPDRDGLHRALTQAGATVELVDDALIVAGMTASEVGDIARDNAYAVHQLVTERASLEEAFMTLTQNSVEYRATEEAVA